MLKYLFNCLIIVSALFSSTLEAWNETGHMVVAEIAQSQLKPEVKEEVERLIAVLKDDYPQSSTFVTAAAWADDLRLYGQNEFIQWHYMTIPYDPENFLTQEDQDRLSVDQKSNNVKWALGHCINKLKDPNADDGEKAKMLCFLLHFAGDIHQPLHCASLFSKKFPQGDVGGNLYKINVVEKNLHKYWDAGGGLLQIVPRPLDETGQAYIAGLAQEAMEAYPYKLARAHLDTKFSAWAKESYFLATTVSYQISEGTEPTEEYVAEVKETAKARVALAGYRLAHLLNGIFS